MKKLLVLALFFIPSSYAKTLVYCSEGSPDYFNPQLSLSGTSFDASNLLYSRLVETDPSGKKILPGLSHKWTSSKDKKTWTFHLRKNVSFYPQGDFTPSRAFNADDVLFSFERQRDKKHPFHKVNGGSYKFFYSLGLNKLISKIEKKDDYTVLFHLNNPSPIFLKILAMEFAVILSKEYADFLTKKGKQEKIDFEPVGTGPFILTKYARASQIKYKRNENFYGGPASLKKVVFSITPDPSIRFQKLKRGECHIYAKPQPSDVVTLKKHKKLKLSQVEAHNLAYLAFNTTHPILKNKKVRRAIAHSLNRKLYIEAIYKGLAKTLDTPVPPGLTGHNDKIKFPEYNIKKAKALLKEAGYEKGFEIGLWTLPLSRPYNPNGKKMGELMQADLKKIGIKAKLITFDWPTYLAKSSRGEHEMVQMGWSADIADASNFLQVLLTCKSIKGGSNLSQFCNKDYDKLIEKALSLDPKKASPFYKKAQALFHKELPLLPLFHSYVYTGLSNKVEGYVSKASGSERFYHLSLK